MTAEYAAYLHDLLRPLGPIRHRRMFGGLGIYAGDLFFALVVDEQLYFKADAQSRALFEAEGLVEWCYARDGKIMHMNYFQPPESVFDDEAELLHWGRLALAAAARALRKKAARPAARPADKSGTIEKAEKTEKTAGGKRVR